MIAQRHCLPRDRETTISTSGNRDTTRCDTNFVVNYLLFILTLNTQRLARPEVALSIEEGICEDDDEAGAQVLGHTGGPLHIFVVVLWLPPYPKPI